MAALDTNILARCLVQDDPAQFELASKRVRSCLAEGLTLFDPVTVALELEWVLRSTFGFTKDAVIQALSLRLSSDELTFESERALEFALANYKKSGAD
jgi:predicted nucleic-acid-binding protein